MKKDIRNMIDAMEKLMNSMQELINNYYAKYEPVSEKNVKTINLDTNNITVKNLSDFKANYEEAIEKAKLFEKNANKKANFYEFEVINWFATVQVDGGVCISTHSNKSTFVGEFENGAYIKINKKLYIVEDGDLKYLAEVIK